MQLRTLITAGITLAPQLVSSQNVTRWLEVQASFPPCARSCLATSYARRGEINSTDIYGTCNDPTLLKYLVDCEGAEAGNCNDDDRQTCAVVGGIASTVYTYRFSGLPACANNCTSSGLLVSGCQGDNVLHCVCKSPSFADSYGPCVQSVCNASEIADTVTYFTKGCAPFGGIGPFNATDIGSYLNFTGPNRTLPFYPPFYTSENATNGTYTSPPVAPFTSGAAFMMMRLFGCWSLFGLIGAIMLI